MRNHKTGIGNEAPKAKNLGLTYPQNLSSPSPYPTYKLHGQPVRDPAKAIYRPLAENLEYHAYTIFR